MNVRPLVFLGLFLLQPVKADPPTDPFSAINKTQEALAQEWKEIKGKYAKEKAEIDKAHDDQKTLTKEISDLAGEISESEKKLDDEIKEATAPLDDEIEKLKGELAAKEENLETAITELKDSKRGLNRRDKGKSIRKDTRRISEQARKDLEAEKAKVYSKITKLTNDRDTKKNEIEEQYKSDLTKKRDEKKNKEGELLTVEGLIAKQKPERVEKEFEKNTAKIITRKKSIDLYGKGIERVSKRPDGTPTYTVNEGLQDLDRDADLAALKDVAYPGGKTRRDDALAASEPKKIDSDTGDPVYDKKQPILEIQASSSPSPVPASPGTISSSRGPEKVESTASGSASGVVAPSPAINNSSTQPASETSNNCESAITDYFKTADQGAIQRFLRIQADLTTQRLGWAFLKSIADGSPNLTKAEDSILDLLNKKYGPQIDRNKDQFVGPGKLFNDEKELAAFNQARNKFEEAPLSRRALANVGPHLSRILKHQLGADQTSTPFLLSDADVKMLDLLATANGNQDNRQYGSRVVNLMKLVDSAVRDKDLGIESVARALKKLEKQIKSLTNDYEKLAMSHAKEITACQSEDSRKALACSAQAAPSVDRLLLDCQDAIGAMYEGIKLRSDQKTALEFGNIWSRINLKGSEATGCPASIVQAQGGGFCPPQGKLNDLKTCTFAGTTTLNSYSCRSNGRWVMVSSNTPKPKAKKVEVFCNEGNDGTGGKCPPRLAAGLFRVCSVTGDPKTYKYTCGANGTWTIEEVNNK